jgi:hypothetical protein
MSEIFGKLKCLKMQKFKKNILACAPRELKKSLYY